MVLPAADAILIRFAHNQHRQVCAADDLFGVAAENHPTDTAPAVRTQHHQIRTPLACLLGNQVAQATRLALDQRGVDRNPAAALDAATRLLQDPFATVLEQAKDICVHRPVTR